QHLLNHVLVAGFFQIRDHNRLGVGVGFRSGQPELLCGPQAQEPVAPGRHLELDFLVVLVLGLETLFAFVEAAHCLVLLPAAFGLYGGVSYIAMQRPAGETQRGGASGKCAASSFCSGRAMTGPFSSAPIVTRCKTALGGRRAGTGRIDPRWWR